MSARSAGFKADGVLLLITAMWGLTFVVVKDALNDASPFLFLALRHALGAGLVLAVARGRVDRAAWAPGALLGLCLFASLAFQTWGLWLTTPARSAFITGLSVALVPVASFLLFRTWPRWIAVLGITFAVVGLAVLTGVLREGFGANGDVLAGDALTLGCAVAYGFHVALTERFAPRYSVSSLVSVQLLATAVLALGCVPLTAFHFVPTGRLGGALLFTGVFASGVAIFSQTWAQARTSAVRAALIFSLEPVFASVYSVWMGREVLGAPELAGGALIVAGVVISEVGSALLARRAAPPRGSDAGLL